MVLCLTHYILSLSLIGKLYLGFFHNVVSSKRITFFCFYIKATL